MKTQSKLGICRYQWGSLILLSRNKKILANLARKGMFHVNLVMSASGKRLLPTRQINSFAIHARDMVGFPSITFIVRCVRTTIALSARIKGWNQKRSLWIPSILRNKSVQRTMKQRLNELIWMTLCHQDTQVNMNLRINLMKSRIPEWRSSKTAPKTS